MPSINFSRSVAAGAVDVPISAIAWAYEQLPYPAQVTILVRTTATGVLAAVMAGSESIQDETPVQSGGTAGVTPSPLNTLPIEFVGGAGDRISLRLRNTTGGALTVDGVITVNPLGM